MPWAGAITSLPAVRAALRYSLIEPCKLNGVEPYAYRKDVLTRIGGLFGGDAESFSRTLSLTVSKASAADLEAIGVLVVQDFGCAKKFR
ncbi:transposase domain-containing protein [Candidatus Methylocalor cossyra]|uniref:transposase domain-containing protein n=1 Tax=Candidatus Methylocalor cossyra TaxID=3108543 RepID=UPI003D6C893B